MQISAANRWGKLQQRVRSSAFTLVEIVAVLLLVGLLTAIVTTSLSAMVKTESLESCMTELTYWDHLARQDAIRTGRGVSLVYDVPHQTITIQDRDTRKPIRQTHLNWRWALAEVKNQAQNTNEIKFNSHGFTQPYAVKFSKPDMADQWLLMLGLTGESVVINQEEIGDWFERETVGTHSH